MARDNEQVPDLTRDKWGNTMDDKWERDMELIAKNPELLDKKANRELKKILKAHRKDKKKHEKADKCGFDKHRLCDATCKFHSHNERFKNIKVLQKLIPSNLMLKKGYCTIRNMLAEGKLSLKEAKDMFEGV